MNDCHFSHVWPLVAKERISKGADAAALSIAHHLAKAMNGLGILLRRGDTGWMKTNFDHLPEGKQRELALVVRILFEEFAAVTARATQQWKKGGRILKVVLYGSYARGD